MKSSRTYTIQSNRNERGKDLDEYERRETSSALEAEREREREREREERTRVQRVARAAQLSAVNSPSTYYSNS